MAYHFSAEQYDKAFLPKRLGNWELPHWYPRRPRAPDVRRAPTTPLADINGRLLPRARRLNPGWGFRRTAWDYPNKITKDLANELSKDPLPGRYTEWQQESKSKGGNDDDDNDDVGAAEGAQPSRENVVADLDTFHKSDNADVDAEEKTNSVPALLPPVNDNNTVDVPERKMSKNDSDIIGVDDPHKGFFYARKMHMDNLLHRPLPDALGTKQSNMRMVPGRDLNVKPYSVNEFGPRDAEREQPPRPVTSTHHLPKVPKKHLAVRPATTDKIKKTVTPMDLAICWDFRTVNPRDEPKRPKHIDGSNGSMAPAVFSMIRDKLEQQTVPDTGRSNAIFSQNIVHGDCNNDRIVPSFDKDMSKNKRKEACETPNCPQHAQFEKKSVKCDGIHGCGSDESYSSKGSQFLSKEKRERAKDRVRSAWSEVINNNNNKNDPSTREKTNRTRKNSVEIDSPVNVLKSKLSRSSPNLNCPPDCKENPKINNKNNNSNNRSCTACKKDDNDHNNSNNGANHREEYKMAFKAGKPNSMGSSEGCKNGDVSGSNTTKNSIRIPKMKDPYGKKSYSIPTLAPPFSRWHDTSGYPEHWRLASVYQHAYKTPDPKRRPLLPAVYQ